MIDRQRAVAWVGWLVAAGVAGAAAQGPMFTARHDLVRLDVLVTRDGRPVSGLTASDFVVRDNGVPQKIELVGGARMPINAVLAFDTSASLAGDRLAQLNAAGHALLAALEPADQAAFVTFNESVAVRVPLTTDVGRAREALDRVQGEGETSLFDGVFAGLQLGEAENGHSLIIVFSDGIDSSSWLSADTALDAAHRSASVVYAVTEGHHKRPPFLDAVTQATGGALIEIESTAGLGAQFLRILDEFRHRYVLGYSPQGVQRTGWHRVEVHVNGAAVVTRSGYQAGNLP